LALGLGAIGDVGYLTRDSGKAALVKRMSGNVQMSARDVTATLDRLLQDGALNDPVVHVTPMRWGATSAALKTMSGPSFRLLRNLGRREGEGVDTESLRDVLIGLPRAKAEERLSAFLVGRIAHILHVSEKTISIRRPITELGMDSLMGVELGLTLQESLGSDLPVTAVSDGLSIAQIADRIVTHLHEESGTESPLSAHQSANQSLIKQHLNSDNAPRPVPAGGATASIAPFRPVAAKTAKQGFPA
jgi:acyl carrier protein